MTYLDYFPYPMPAAAAIPLSVMIGLIGLGVGGAYYISEPRSPATRALALASALTGIAIMVYLPTYQLRPTGWLWQWLYVPVIDVAIMSELFAWIFYEAKVAQPTPQAMRLIKGCAWLFAAATAVYFVLGWQHQQLRLDEFVFCLSRPDGCNTRGFWLFGPPVAAMTFFLSASMVILFRQRIDPAERVRAIWVAIATPFFFAVYILPFGYGLFSTLLAYIISTIGLLHYHRLQSERGVFMSRFLSPEVAKLVRMQGLSQTMQPRKLELTAVCCDLRGFTHFSMEHDSDQVTQLLGEYYETVGRAVTEFGATIKDYAGDGILILIGAPLPVSDHATQGLALARRVLSAAESVTRRWTRPATPLGAGIGVASGKVTVGAIGSASRMEYTAVGPAVNLASRLCAQAGDGEILVSQRTSELVGSNELVSREPLAVKGMGEVPHYALTAS